jgi:hypothetical protein
MYEMPEPPHIDLPEGWVFTPVEPESFEDWFDAKCTAAHEFNKANGYYK